MNLYTVSFLRSAPFIRILVPFITGIIVQFYFSLQGYVTFLTLFSAVVISIFLNSLNLAVQHRYVLSRSLFVCIAITSCGCLTMHLKNPADHSHSLYKRYKKDHLLLVKILEPLTEKPGSYKSLGRVEYAFDQKQVHSYTGTIIMYFSKDSLHRQLKYGDLLIIRSGLQEVSSTGNPGAFDFRAYCYRQRIHYQVYLAANNFISTGLSSTSVSARFIFSLRKTIVSLLERYVPGRKESGLAQALLIGYKDNLDKDLIQSYSNTGVVHVIAISGLHLGLIYAILIILVKPLKRRWLQLIFVLTGIWIFTLLAGASPSVVRSAVMFSCIALGNAIERKASIYNSLAASAFILLSYDPFWLWDTGFQLSYTAVLSIIIFQKPVYHLLNLENKILDLLWKTCAVTLAAQILTTPVTLYYFHQFPILFLAANLVAIPLSSAVLIAEIILCMFSFFPAAATLAGKSVALMINLMNFCVGAIDGHRFANWEFLQIDLAQVLLLYLVIIAGWILLMYKLKRAIYIGMSGLIIFFGIRTISFYRCAGQSLLIVYNIPRRSATEFIAGRKSVFIADSLLYSDLPLQRFHIRPARILYRVSFTSIVKTSAATGYTFLPGRNAATSRGSPAEKVKIPDIMILNGNIKRKVSELFHGVYPTILVFDSSVPKRRIEAWRKECDSLGIHTFSVQDEGAFVMNLN